MPLYNTLVHAIDTLLWRYGFRIEKVRLSMRYLVLFNILALCIACIALIFTKAILSFALASILSSLNFFVMAKNILLHFPLGGTRKVTAGTLFSSTIRLFAILFFSLIGILVMQLPPIPWFVGLGLPIIVSPIVFAQNK